MQAEVPKIDLLNTFGKTYVPYIPTGKMQSQLASVGLAHYLYGSCSGSPQGMLLL